MNEFIIIDGCKIGKDYFFYIIVEFLVNYNGDINCVFKIMEEVKVVGVDVIKL